MARALDLTLPAIRRIARRYLADGAARVVFDAPRSGAAEVLTASDKQRVIAMVCGPMDAAPRG